MERRVLIALFMSFLVLYAYQTFFSKPAPKPASSAASTEPAAATTPAATNEGTPVASTPTATALVGESSEYLTAVHPEFHYFQGYVSSNGFVLFGQVHGPHASLA